MDTHHKRSSEEMIKTRASSSTNFVKVAPSAKGHSYVLRLTDKLALEAKLDEEGILESIREMWRTLPCELPSHIHVWKFKDREDLMRVVIVGLRGTPFQHALFVFDFHLMPLDITFRGGFQGFQQIEVAMIAKKKAETDAAADAAGEAAKAAAERAGVGEAARKAAKAAVKEVAAREAAELAEFKRLNPACLYWYLNQYWTPTDIEMMLPLRHDVSYSWYGLKHNLEKQLEWLNDRIQSGEQLLWEEWLEEMAPRKSYSGETGHRHQMCLLMCLRIIIFVLEAPPEGLDRFVYRHFAEHKEEILRTYEELASGIGECKPNIGLKSAISHLLPSLRRALSDPRVTLSDQ